MKINIAIYISNYGMKDIDISSILDGNPGIGGTQYEMFLFCILMKDNPNYNLSVFLDYPQKGFNFANVILKNEIDGIAEICKRKNISVIIFRANFGLEHLNNFSNTKVIYWVHNNIDYKSSKLMSKTDQVAGVVFVSKQQYDLYRDLSVIKKSTYVFNTPNTENKIPKINEKEKILVFTGNLVPITKFHVVASMWPKILKKVPDAKLYVIGSGRNGNRTFELGPRGIAEKSYETKIFDPLIKSNTLDSVKFFGNLGIEKNNIIQKCKVAIAPNEKETFCLCACEYILNGVPTVAIKSGGLGDVVINKKTGYLCSSYKKMFKKIIKILNGKSCLIIDESNTSYIKERFSYKSFIMKWDSILKHVVNNNSFAYVAPTKPFTIQYKWLGVIFEWVQKHFHISDKFSRLGIREILRK